MKVNGEVRRSVERGSRARQEATRRKQVLDSMLDRHLSMEQLNTHEKHLLGQLRDSLQRHAEESFIETSRRSYRKYDVN